MLAAGTRLGPYEIQTPLGAGGMGEVYRARDTRLGREVAIKVLPEQIVGGADARERFEREARAASSLSHPNIITVYDVGGSSGADWVAMELIEGSSLRDVMGSSRVPTSRMLEIGRQISDGLARAHAAGIVHRDLKPENVMITKDGFVKILDFGLAKLTLSDPSETNAPTVPATEPGTVMGTVGYMSPEQAAARTVDYRSDQFSLGVVLYEMAAGKRPFERATKAQTLASIIQDDPEPIGLINPTTPAALRWLIERCLQKDPEERYASTKDLARDIKSIRDHLSEATSTRVPAARSHLFGRSGRLILAASLAGAAVATAFFVLVRLRPEASRPVRFQILSSHTSPFQDSGPPYDIPQVPELSPNGRLIAFPGVCPDGKDRIWIQSLEAIGSHPLPGTEDASYPFWSPDSVSIGFFANGKLKRISASGGPVEILCDANGRGGTWGPDGTILFGGLLGGVSRVSSSGGSPAPVTKVDSARREASHRWPRFLPDGRHFLYFSYLEAGKGDQNGGLFVAALDSTERKRVFTSVSNAIYAPPGYLLSYRDGNLVAQPFDSRRLELAGEPRPVAELVNIDPAKKLAFFSVSETGVVTYGSGLPTVPSRLLWFDRSGREIGSAGETGFIADVRLSRDGKRAAFTQLDAQTGAGSIWLCDLARNSVTRFAEEIASNRIDYEPVWSPDGRALAFSAMRTGAPQLYRKSVDGTSGETLISPRPSANQEAMDWSADGKLIVYNGHDFSSGSDYSLWLTAAEGGQKPKGFLAGALDGRLSPDGNWIAYSTQESGKSEIYVTPFPGPGPRVKISTAGGSEPRWRRDGKEMYYLDLNDDVMALDIKLAPTLDASVPHELFHTRPARIVAEFSSYDVSPDGTQFLVNTLLGEKMPPPFTVILNWASELKK